MADALMGEMGLWFSVGHVTSLLRSGLGYVLEGRYRCRPFVVGRVLTGFAGGAYEEYGLKAGGEVFMALRYRGVLRVVPAHYDAPLAAIVELQELIHKSDSSAETPREIKFKHDLHKLLGVLYKSAKNKVRPNEDFDIPEDLRMESWMVSAICSQRQGSDRPGMGSIVTKPDSVDHEQAVG